MTSSSAGITDPVYRGRCGRTSVRSGGRKAASGATPRPVFGAVDETRSHRVLEHVPARRFQVLLPFDHPRRVAIAEEVAGPPVALVEAQGVDAVQAVHPA